MGVLNSIVSQNPPILQNTSPLRLETVLSIKLQTELKHTEQVVKRRVSLSNQDVTKQVYCCILCGQTPLPEGQYSEQDWKACHDCQNTLCPNCVVQISKNVDSEVFWLCKLCQKKRQLTVSSGSWLQRLPKNNNNKQTKELQKLIQKTHGITRTASYSQYEDLIDQVSLDESTVNSGDQDEHDGEEEKEEEWKQLIQKDNTQLVKSHENSILKNFHQRRASEQNSNKEVVKSTHRIYHSINDNQPVNNETRKLSMGQKFLRLNDDVIHDDDDDVDKDNYKNLTYQNRLHLYFTKQVSEQFSMDSEEDDDDDNVSEKDNQKCDFVNFHDKSNESNQNDQLNETILHNNKSSTIVQQLHHEECYDGIDMIDEIQKITPADVIDEKAIERKEIVQSTYTNVPLDNSDQINLSRCTVSPTNILSDHHTDKQQFIPEDYTISSMNYLNTPYSDNQEHLIKSNSDQIIINDQVNIIESFNSYLINQKNDPFNEENLLIYHNRQSSINQYSKDDDISLKNLEKTRLCNTYTQSYEDKIGLIIPQYNSDEYNEDMNIIINNDNNNNNETKHLSQSLLTNQDNGRYSNHIHLQCNNQSRRQSCPIIINDDHVLSLSNQMIQQQQQQPCLSSKSSYFEDVNTDDHDDDDDNEDRFIHSYYDQPNSYHSNRLSNHEMNSNHLNLFFPYNLNESWDYAEDLRKIDENIYQRTSNSNKTIGFNDITYDTINSSIFNENENNIIHTALSKETTNVTSVGSYYIDDTIKSSIKDHDIHHEPSMNDLYLNWLNELNSNYVSMNQHDNLLSTNYNVNKHEDYISECSLINNSSSQDTSVSNYITTTTITGNSNTETNEQNHLLLKRCPNFENISRLSNNNNDNNINNNIQLMEESSSFYEGLMKLSEVVNDEKEDLEMNNDTPTKVWGREFRDRLQISDTSTCLPSNLFDDIKPELEIWSNLFNTSEIVVDTAREISTQLNLLSTLEEDDIKEERNEWKEKVEINIEKQAENKKDNEVNQTDHDQYDKNDKQLVDSRSHIFITTLENEKLNALKDNEVSSFQLKTSIVYIIFKASQSDPTYLHIIK
ncbi:unnamed protein product [Schistosoma margrebowiei]|uniref:Uncharacterized protein n=1 Tax=Schistosoma margrebowiei TaxID=48269 RepID=A0A183LAV0_9TREM|nr:unnamed protein product [Schistosoma margrebowiei]